MKSNIPHEASQKIVIISISTGSEPCKHRVRTKGTKYMSSSII